MKPQVCDVCLENVGADGGGTIRLGACGHRMCCSCSAAWCSSAAPRCLQQGVPLRCALPRCGRAVPLQQAQQLFDMAGMMSAEVGTAFGMAALIPEEAQFCCPYPDCGALSELEAALPDAPSACPSCGRGVCPSCRCMWHAGLRCSQYQALGAGSAADKRCRVFWRRSAGAAERRSGQQHHQQQQYHFQQQQQQPHSSPMSP